MKIKLYVIFLIFIGGLYAQTPFNSNIKIVSIEQEQNGYYSSREPFIAINPIVNNNFIVVDMTRKWFADCTSDQGRIGIYTTTDYGDNWSKLKVGSGSSGVFDPTVTFFTDGNAACAFLEVDNAPADYRIVLMRSIDNGLTWSSEIVESGVVGSGQFYGLDKPVLTRSTLINSNNGCLVYTKPTEYEFSVEDNQCRVVMFNQQNTSSPITINYYDENINIKNPYPAFDREGNIYVSFFKITDLGENELKQINIMKSTNGGISFDAFNETNNEKIVGDVNDVIEINFSVPRVHSMHSFAIDTSNSMYQNDLYIVWTEKVGDNPSNSTDIYLSKSSDGGNNWTILGNIVPGNLANEFRPCVSVDPWGVVHVLFYEVSTIESKTIRSHMVYSKNGGISFQYNLEFENQFVEFNIDNVVGGESLGDYNGIASNKEFVIPAYINFGNGPFCPQNLNYTNTVINTIPNRIHLNPTNKINQVSTGSLKINNAEHQSAEDYYANLNDQYTFESNENGSIPNDENNYKFRNWEDITPYQQTEFDRILINLTFGIQDMFRSPTSNSFKSHSLTVHNYLEGGSGGSYDVTWTTPNPEREQGTFQSLEIFNAFDSSDNDDKYQITIEQTIPGQYGTNWEFQYWDDGSTLLTRSNIAVSEPTTLKA